MSLQEKLSAVPALLELTARSHYKNSDVVKYYNNMTMQKALNAKSKSIGLIAKEDEATAIRCIGNLFKGTALYFDVNLSQAKTELIATEILSKYEYRNLKLEDLVAICIRIKESNAFKLTVAKIMNEIRQYSKEREQLAIHQSLQQSESQKNSINSDLEARLHKSFKSLPNVDKIASKRLSVKNKFQ